MIYLNRLLNEALEKYQQWKDCRPPIAPPRDKYNYEEACTVMWHDGAVNAYEQMIGLIRKYERTELTEKEQQSYKVLRHVWEDIDKRNVEEAFYYWQMEDETEIDKKSQITEMYQVMGILGG